MKPFPLTGSSAEDVLAARVVDLVAATLGKNLARQAPSELLLSGRHPLDSVALLELVLRLEEAFGISIPDEDLDPDHFETVQTLAAYIRHRLENPA